MVTGPVIWVPLLVIFCGHSTHSGYGTVPVGCRVGSRYVERCWWPFSIKFLDIKIYQDSTIVNSRFLTKKWESSIDLDTPKFKNYSSKSLYTFKKMFDLIRRCSYFHTSGFSFFSILRFPKFPRFHHSPRSHHLKPRFFTKKGWDGPIVFDPHKIQTYQ